jgi:prepilin-type N-terminal cleavage/methylation domain-containing protein
MLIIRARGHRWAFTLVEIMIVVAVIGLLAAIAIPNFVNARARSQATGCINNLRMIDDAASQFAIEAHKSTGVHVSLNRDLTPYIKMNATGKLPACPARGTYGIENIGDTPVCSLANSVTPAHVMP